MTPLRPPSALWPPTPWSHPPEVNDRVTTWEGGAGPLEGGEREGNQMKEHTTGGI